MFWVTKVLTLQRLSKTVALMIPVSVFREIEWIDKGDYMTKF